MEEEKQKDKEEKKKETRRLFLWRMYTLLEIS